MRIIHRAQAKKQHWPATAAFTRIFHAGKDAVRQ
jgi:hypothetical protein